MAIHGTVLGQQGQALSGVAVSNGESVVKTDASGCFGVEADPRLHPFIFALRPSDMLGGTWFCRTPKDRAEVTLQLQPLPGAPASQETVRLGHITDTHLNVDTGAIDAMTPQMLVEDLEWMRASALALDVVVAGGDLTERGETHNLEALKWAFDHSPIPVMPMFGGHDSLSERRVPDSGHPFTRYWEQVMGPTYYAFGAGEWLVVLYQDEDPVFGPERAAIKERWLQAVLADRGGQRVAVCTHQHPDLDWVEKLSEHGVELVFHGHWHCSRCLVHAGVQVVGTPPLPFGGIDTMPRGFRLIELGPDGPQVPYTPYARLDSTPARGVDASQGSGSQGSGSLRIQWRVSVDGQLHRGQPLRVADRVLVPVADEGAQGRAGVLCLDAHSGARRWFHGTEHSVRAGLAAADDTIVAATQTGELLAMDLDSGQSRWTQHLNGYPDRWVCSAPQICRGAVTAGTGGGLQAFGMDSGADLWQWTHKDYRAGRFGDAWPHFGLPCPVDEGIPQMVHVRGVTMLDPDSGDERWHYPTYYAYTLAPVIRCRDSLLVPDRPSMHQLLFHAVDPETGQCRWSRDVDAYEITGWSADDGIIALNTACHRLRPNAPSYDPTGMGTTQARSATDGSLLWSHAYDTDLMDMGSYRRGMGTALCAPLITHQHVYLAGMDGRLRQLSREDGQLLEELDLGEPLMAGAAVGGGDLVFTTYQGTVVCIGTTSG